MLCIHIKREKEDYTAVFSIKADNNDLLPAEKIIELTK